MRKMKQNNEEDGQISTVTFENGKPTHFQKIENCIITVDEEMIE